MAHMRVIAVSVNIAHGCEVISHLKLETGAVLTKEEMAMRINSGIDTYYTVKPSFLPTHVLVEAVLPNTPRTYVRSTPDGTLSDNLLKLPHF